MELKAIGKDTINIFMWDIENGRKILRRKLWVYDDGSVTVRTWNNKGKQVDLSGKELKLEDYREIKVLEEL